MSGVARRWRTRGLVAGLVLLLAALAGSAPTPGPALDPRSTDPSGLRGVVDVLQRLDVDVVVSRDPDRAEGVAAVLALPGVDPQVVDDLVRPGARVVSTVPPQDVDGAPVGIGVAGLGAVRLEVGCDLLDGVTALAAGSWTGWALPDGDQRTTCVAVGDGWWLVVDGDPSVGEHVHVTTLEPFVNARLGADDGDPGLAAVRLLADAGEGGVLLLEPGAPEPGLLDLVPDRVVDAVLLGVLATGLLAAARGRRFGVPPDERLPVRVPGGELVAALGDLRARAGQRAATAASLRAETLRRLRRRLRLAPDADVDEVVAALAAAGHDTPDARATLAGPDPHDDDGLVALAAALARLRAAVEPDAPDAPDAPDVPDQSTTTPRGSLP